MPSSGTKKQIFSPRPERIREAIQQQQFLQREEIIESESDTDPDFSEKQNHRPLRQKYYRSIAVLLQRLQVENVYILGDAPNLVEFEKVTPVAGIVIGMSRTYKRFPVDYHFFACGRYLADDRKNFDLELSAIHADSFGYLGFADEYFFRPTWNLSTRISRSLKAGHCVLIPTLHFACLLRPKRIFLYGVDMRGPQVHWYNNIAVRRKFPSRKRICLEVKQLLELFPDIEVISGSRENILVQRGIIRTGRVPLEQLA